MKLETAKLIAKYGKEDGYEVRVDEAYSGRHMNGQTTAALVGSEGEIRRAIASTCFLLGRGGLDDGYETVRETEDFRWDTLGKYERVAY